MKEKQVSRNLKTKIVSTLSQDSQKATPVEFKGMKIKVLSNHTQNLVFTSTNLQTSHNTYFNPFNDPEKEKCSNCGTIAQQNYLFINQFSQKCHPPLSNVEGGLIQFQHTFSSHLEVVISPTPQKCTFAIKLVTQLDNFCISRSNLVKAS